MEELTFDVNTKENWSRGWYCSPTWDPVDFKLKYSVGSKHWWFDKWLREMFEQGNTPTNYKRDLTLKQVRGDEYILTDYPHNDWDLKLIGAWCKEFSHVYPWYLVTGKIMFDTIVFNDKKKNPPKEFVIDGHRYRLVE